MKSYKVTAFGEALEESVEETPAPQGTEVLVRVAACGVCHSDVHLREGFFDLGDVRVSVNPLPTVRLLAWKCVSSWEAGNSGSPGQGLRPMK